MTSDGMSSLASRWLQIACAALLLACAGCGSKHDEVVGQWKVTSDTSELVWDFASDGSVTSGDMRGRYSFTSQKRMKLQTSFATFLYDVDVKGDKMTWTNPNGTVTELTRVK